MQPLCAVEKQQILNILSVYMQASVFNMQCACAMLSTVAYPILQNISTLSHKRPAFRKKKLLDMICVLVFSATIV